MDAVFTHGNLDSWNFAVTQYIPQALNTITKTVDPVVSAALLALVGNTSLFSKDTGNIQFSYDKDGIPFSLLATLEYKVPSFKVANATEEAIEKDRLFILAYLKQVQNITISNLTLDTQKGVVSLAITLKIGYQV